MGVIATLREYFGPTGTDPSSKARDTLRYAAVGITVGYSIALVYRAGGFKYLLPSSVYEGLVNKVERLKEGTQPLVNKERFGLCSKHLIRTYGLLTCGGVLSAIGSRVFFAAPDLPIGVPIAFSATAATALLFARQWMTPAGKMLAYGTVCLATGVSFGPLNWVAYDSVLPFAIIVGSTAVGFCAPLYITRGVVSYFCSAQLLSCSLSVVGAGMLVASAKANGGALSSSARRVEKDVSAMITFQVLANAALGALHTLPTIYRFMKKPLKELADEDPVYQASLIFGAAAYTLFSAFRIACTRVFNSLSRKEKEKVKEQLKGAADVLSNTQGGLFTIKNMSNVGASLMFLITYVRIVTYMQSHKDGSAKALDFSRKVFAKLSPL